MAEGDIQARGGIRGDSTGAEFSSDLAAALACGRDGFRDVFDLMHIFAERPGRGDHTRAALNPLLVLLAASAWERQWHALSSPLTPSRELRFAPRLMRDEGPEAATAPGYAAKALHELTGGQLPAGVEVRDFQRARGTRLMTPRVLSGSDFAPDSTADSPCFTALAERLNIYIRIRNGVAHRTTGEKLGPSSMSSDAASGRTLNTSIARVCVAFFLQLVDQTTETLLSSPPEGVKFTDAEVKAIRLPQHWLSDEGGGTPARRFGPGELWGGVDLRRQQER